MHGVGITSVLPVSALLPEQNIDTKDDRVRKTIQKLYMTL